MSGDAGDDMLSWDESVFRDESVFEIDHVPETFRHRESQLESLKYALRPAVRGSRPLNTVVRGPPGTGKTTAVQKLFAELGARTAVRTVRVNCQVDSTRYASSPGCSRGSSSTSPRRRASRLKSCSDRSRTGSSRKTRCSSSP